jgi:hypothetical protein
LRKSTTRPNAEGALCLLADEREGFGKGGFFLCRSPLAGCDLEINAGGDVGNQASLTRLDFPPSTQRHHEINGTDPASEDHFCGEVCREVTYDLLYPGPFWKLALNDRLDVLLRRDFL